MPYTLPEDIDQRPVAIDGAGMLGQRMRQYARPGEHLRCRRGEVVDACQGAG